MRTTNIKIIVSLPSLFYPFMNIYLIQYLRTDDVKQEVGFKSHA